jgi:hypothetical protein
MPMQIVIDVDDVRHADKYGTREVEQLSWTFDTSGDDNGLAMGFANGQSSRYVSNETREQCFCLVIAADRRLSYQLSYSSQWKFLSKLMRKFHQALTADDQRVRELEKHFEHIKRIFQGVSEFDALSKEVIAQVADLAGNFESRSSYGTTSRLDGPPPPFAEACCPHTNAPVRSVSSVCHGTASPATVRAPGPGRVRPRRSRRC